MGMILAYWPLAKEAAILHLPLTIGVFFVGWNYVPIWSLVLDFAIMVYGRVKFWTDIYPNIIVDAERVGRARTRRPAPARAPRRATAGTSATWRGSATSSCPGATRTAAT